MGQIKDPGKTKAENGLFGYSNGQQTIKLDAETGNATFGVAGKGQIHIDGTSAKITGGDYEYGSSGMEINLQEPSITYGNGNFTIDK